jgi:hypothetical protein
LADLWGYVLSQDEDFVGRSLPFESSRRKITNKLWVAISQQDLERVAIYAEASVQTQVAYELGSQLSKTLRVLLAPVKGPKEKAKIIIGAVVNFAKYFHSLKPAEVANSSQILEIFAEDLKPLPFESCEALKVWQVTGKWGC